MRSLREMFKRTKIYGHFIRKIVASRDVFTRLESRWLPGAGQMESCYEKNNDGWIYPRASTRQGE